MRRSARLVFRHKELLPFPAAGSHTTLKAEFWSVVPMLSRGIPSALTQAMPGTAAFDMAAASLPLGSAEASGLIGSCRLPGQGCPLCPASMPPRGQARGSMGIGQLGISASLDFVGQGIAFPSFALPPSSSAPDLSQQLKEAQAMVAP